METPEASDLKAYPTCKICDRGTLMPRKIRRLSGPAVAIGYILLIPSILGMAACAILLIVSLLAGVAGAAHWSAFATAFAGIGAIAFVYIGILSFVFGLVGWLLIMKKHVLQCVYCGAVVDAAAAVHSHPNRSFGRASVFGFFFLFLILVAITVGQDYKVWAEGGRSYFDWGKFEVLTHKGNTPAQPTYVPFVGCKSDDQVGPQDAPTGKPKIISISPQLAQTVAYYQASDGLGVLAPRGWYCLGTSGSAGSDLYITPMPLNSEGIPGYGIDLGERSGGTSGRFDVAGIIARVFPAHWDFVRQVIAEGIEPASSFPYGPYPADELTYKGKDTVEYVTPPNTKGLGTSPSLGANAYPIEGVVILTNDEIREMSANGTVISEGGKELDLTQLSARLPPEMTELVPVIIRQIEQDSSQSSQMPQP